jgi:hypothetical protein
MVTVYVLKLQEGKYYVGRSNEIDKRLTTHFVEPDVQWVKKYPAEEVIAIYRNCDDFDEDKYTWMYMHKYGIANVRGGCFAGEELNIEEIHMLHRLICFSRGMCRHCEGKKPTHGNAHRHRFEPDYHDTVLN